MVYLLVRHEKESVPMSLQARSLYRSASVAIYDVCCRPECRDRDRAALGTDGGSDALQCEGRRQPTHTHALGHVSSGIDREKPAHTSYEICVVEPGIRVGYRARLGIDTLVGHGPV